MLRSDDGAIEVAWVPPHQMVIAFRAFDEFLQRGLKATQGTLTPEDLVRRLREGGQLGIAYNRLTGDPLGVFFVELYEDAARICALSGRQLSRWSGLMEKLIWPWALANNVDVIQAVGKLGWCRVFKGVHPVKLVAGRQFLLQKSYKRGLPA